MWLSCVLVCLSLYRSNVPGKQPGFSRNSPSRAAGPCKTLSLRKWGQRWEFWGPGPVGSAAEQLHMGVRLAAVAHCQFLFFFSEPGNPLTFRGVRGAEPCRQLALCPQSCGKRQSGDRPCPVHGPGSAGLGLGPGPCRGQGWGCVGVPGSHKTIPCPDRPFCAPSARLWGCGG